MEEKKYMSYDGEYSVRVIREFSDGETVIQLVREGHPSVTFTHDAAAMLAVDILDKSGLITTSIATIENVICAKTAEVAKHRKEIEDARRRIKRLADLRQETALRFFKVPYEGLSSAESLLISDHVQATLRREGNK